MGKAVKRKKFSIARLEARYAPFFILPVFALLAVFQIYPMVSGFLISLTAWNGFDNRIPAGFANYTAAFGDVNFRVALLNTCYYVIGCVPGTLVFSLIIASLLSNKIRFTSFFRALYYLPAITSGVSIALIWRWIFNTNYGLLNVTLYSLGMKEMIPWLTSTRYAMPAVIIMSVWKSLGPNIILILAGLQSVSTVFHEAAVIDGANRRQRFFRITLPMLSPTLFMVIILAIISSFQVFDTVLTLTKGGPGNATLVIVYYIYRAAFENFNMGYASAMAFILFVVILAVTIVQWLVKNKWVYSESE
ncbi:MAG: sugar ABC transporter permease [Treponema sp.]|jgi:multiple sugar transport system permease protein|nr:sugar ABC transporter permease [Treponema sp.]